jgi:hypothetical protein
MVQGFIFEGDLRFSKLFKKGVYILKCTEKRFMPFTPSISFLNLSPIQNFKESLPMPHRMYSIIHLSKLSVFQHPFPLYTNISVVNIFIFLSVTYSVF